MDMKVLRHFLKIIDYQTVIISILSLIATKICIGFGFYAKLPLSLIGIAIIFPIVFSINAAYKRREDALKYFASIKGHFWSIFFALRDWPSSADKGALFANEHKKIAIDIVKTMKNYFQKPSNNELAKLYNMFSLLSKLHEKMRKEGVPANEISRINQYLKSIIVDFERIRNILNHRTPISLRAYSKIFLNIFPLLFAPYFAWISNESYLWTGYMVALLYSIVLVSLDNIQEHLENPFDAIGTDDIDFDVSGELNFLMK